MSVFSKITIGVLVLLPLLNFSQSKTKKIVKPNIVLLFADDLGWTDISTGNTNGGRGSNTYETPVIDKLASQGMSFTHAYTNQNCAPSRETISTEKSNYRRWC